LLSTEQVAILLVARCAFLSLLSLAAIGDWLVAASFVEGDSYRVTHQISLNRVDFGYIKQI
jgi:hypothetical protein